MLLGEREGLTSRAAAALVVALALQISTSIVADARSIDPPTLVRAESQSRFAPHRELMLPSPLRAVPVTGIANFASERDVSLLSVTPLVDSVFYGVRGYAAHPSDGTLAVGPSQLLQVVNGAPGEANVGIFDKTGRALVTESLTTLLGIDPRTVMSDPRAIYDSTLGRWFVIAFSGDPSTGSRFYLAISYSNDPTAGFCEFNKDESLVNGISGLAFADFPGLGIDEYGLYVTTVRFSVLTGLAFESQIEMIPRQYLSCGVASIPPYVWNVTAYAPDGRPMLQVQPAIAAQPSGVGYFVGTTTSGSYVGVWNVTHSTSPQLFTNFTPVTPYSRSSPVPQPGTYVLLDAGDTRIATSPIYRNGSLWFAFTARATRGIYGAARWYELAPTTLTVRQQGEVWNDTTAWIYPAVMPDSSGNLVIAATAVGPTLPPTPAFVTRSASDPLGQLSANTTSFGPSGVAYTSLMPGDVVARWGDYFGIGLDSDGARVWAEASFSPDGLSWRTYIASTHVTAAPAVGGYAVTVSNTRPDAGSTVSITAQAVDANRQPLAAGGRVVTWRSSSGGAFSSSTSVTDTRGIATVSLKTTATPSTYVITATDDRGATGTAAAFTTRIPTMTLYLPNVTKTLGGPTGWTTPFYVQNTGQAPTDLDIAFYRFADGALVTQRGVSALPPGASLPDAPNADGDLPDNTQFSVVIKSFGATIAGVVNQLQGVGANTEALAYSGASAGATRLYVPNVTRRFYGYDVPLIIQNLGTQPASVAARFVSFDGTSTLTVPLVVQPLRSGVIDPDYTSGLSDGTQYAVTVISDQPVSVVANAHNEAGSPVAFSHNALATGATTLYAPYAVKAGPDGRFSPVVVQNIGAGPTDVVLDFVPLGATTPHQSFTLKAVAPGASQAFDPRFALGTTTPCATASATCLGAGEYALTLRATVPIAALVLPVSNVTADAYVVPYALASRQFLPVVSRSTTAWNSPLILFAQTTSSATVKWYRTSDRALAFIGNVALVGGSSVLLDPKTVTSLTDNTTYSIVIDATSPIATTVYQQYPGGDGAMIYTGFSVGP